MKFPENNYAINVFILTLISITGIRASNLTCYQCIRNTEAECAPEELLPCPAVSDRCVTHISKDAEAGYSIKRECGLGPCGFNDDMMNKGLGLDGNCDRSRNEYFCIFCCRESGCNKNEAASNSYLSKILLTVTTLLNMKMLCYP